MTAETMSAGYGLPWDLLDAAFPFHMVVDQELRVVQTGTSLRRICPQFVVGTELPRLASVTMPRNGSSFASLKGMHDSLFLLEVLDSDLKLRGQLLYDRATESVLFLGSPWITELADIGVATS